MIFTYIHTAFPPSLLDITRAAPAFQVSPKIAINISSRVGFRSLAERLEDLYKAPRVPGKLCSTCLQSWNSPKYLWDCLKTPLYKRMMWLATGQFRTWLINNLMIGCGGEKQCYILRGPSAILNSPEDSLHMLQQKLLSKSICGVVIGFSVATQWVV